MYEYFLLYLLTNPGGREIWKEMWNKNGFFPWTFGREDEEGVINLVIIINFQVHDEKKSQYFQKF